MPTYRRDPVVESFTEGTDRVQTDTRLTVASFVWHQQLSAGSAPVTVKPLDQLILQVGLSWIPFCMEKKGFCWSEAPEEAATTKGPEGATTTKADGLDAPQQRKI